jgi:hypothetical protein
MTRHKAIELVWSMGEDRSGGGRARPRKVDLRGVGAGQDAVIEIGKVQAYGAETKMSFKYEGKD